MRRAFTVTLTPRLRLATAGLARRPLVASRGLLPPQLPQATFSRCLASGGDDAKVGREERKRGYDATATKPTAVCDPFENSGKPLSESQCEERLRTVSKEWALVDDCTALVREIEVKNFYEGARLLTTIAAVAFNDGHFPLLTLDRRVGRRRRWQDFVIVRCRTVVLGGLSYRDFMLAVLIDSELEKR